MSDLENIQPTQKLTPKHKLFIDEYFRCNMNATKAYRVVYPKVNYDTARANSSELLAKPNIQEHINKRLSEMAMSADEVLMRLSAMARADMLPFIEFASDGFIYFDFSHPDAKEYMFLIKKIKTKRTRRLEGRGDDAETWEDEWVEVELHDSQAALEKIGKYHKLFADRVEISGKDGEAIEFIEVVKDHGE